MLVPSAPPIANAMCCCVWLRRGTEPPPIEPSVVPPNKSREAAAALVDAAAPPRGRPTRALAPSIVAAASPPLRAPIRDPAAVAVRPRIGVWAGRLSNAGTNGLRTADVAPAVALWLLLLVAFSSLRMRAAAAKGPTPAREGWRGAEGSSPTPPPEEVTSTGAVNCCCCW